MLIKMARKERTIMCKSSIDLNYFISVTVEMKMEFVEKVKRLDN